MESDVIHRSIRFSSGILRSLLAGFLVFPMSANSLAGQVDLAGPEGSRRFGSVVKVLPNGNFVVTDPAYSTDVASEIGAVYLFDSNGTKLSRLTGGQSYDRVGSGGVVPLSNGHVVVLSPLWHSDAGAATWMNGESGLDGVVAETNSLVGHPGDEVGMYAFALTNGHYVVSSPSWTGPMTGTHHGAVTWGNGSGGTVGVVTAANSLTGAIGYDRVGFSVTPLTNGNYVVASPFWRKEVFSQQFGAVTWCSGTSATSAQVSSANSLIGAAPGDSVGTYVTALVNGNYVVGSLDWSGDGPISFRGAATWGNGESGTIGVVTETNSIVGAVSGDRVGQNIIALANGNYVVGSPHWSDNGLRPGAGAATWGNGAGGSAGTVSVLNSLVGPAASDAVGYHITPLNDGNYVVGSPYWSGGANDIARGAVTWGNGFAGRVGSVSASNSLTGSSGGDRVGSVVHSLHGNDYVIGSPFWDASSSIPDAGAVTRASSAMIGPVGPGNSLTGQSPSWLGYSITVLANGNLVVGSPRWGVDANSGEVGAVTWVDPANGFPDRIDAGNSLVGSAEFDLVGYEEIRAFSDGSYVVYSPEWNNGDLEDTGAVTLGDGRFRLKGTIQPWNSVLGLRENEGRSIVFDYDINRRKLIVGKPAENMVSVLTIEQVFASDFER